MKVYDWVTVIDKGPFYGQKGVIIQTYSYNDSVMNIKDITVEFSDKSIGVFTENQLELESKTMHPAKPAHPKWNLSYSDGLFSFNDTPKSEGCAHDWKEYVGLFESYKYCKKCNKKEA